MLLFVSLCLCLNAFYVEGRVITKHVGCFMMKGNDRFDGYVGTHLDLTLENCKFLCFTKGYNHAAFRNGSECSCGVFDSKESLPVANNCSVKCSGDSKEICGGTDSFSLYYTGIKDVSVENMRTGCLSDGGVDRLIQQHKLELLKTNSPKTCTGICKSLGYKYAGVENYIECYCGDLSRTEHLSYGCYTLCPGDPKMSCGGLQKMMVYQTGIMDGIPNTKIYYIACLKNKEGGLLRRYNFFHPKMQPLKCIARCYLHGYAYSAIYNGTNCQCGPMPAPYPVVIPESFCSLPCPGDDKKKCGGANYLSAYSNGIIGNPAMGRSIGCFKEEETYLKGFRVNVGIKNSPQYCIFICIERGFIMAGVKNTYECLCTNDYPKRVPLLDVLGTQCNLTCPQSSIYHCGGINRVEIYRTGLDDLYSGEKSCTKSVTEVGGSSKCKGEIIFEEPFETLKLSTWQKTVRMSGEDLEFVIYSSAGRNSYVKNGHLAIKPTLLSDEIVYNGTMNLVGCTGRLNTNECSHQAHTYSILHPIESAEHCTVRSFSFRYGIVTVRAKLPAGDWLYPQIVLKPSRGVYGPGFMSGKIVMARSAGNAALRTSSQLDIGSKVLTSGIMVGTNDDPATVRSKFVEFKSREPWNARYHNYTLIWSPDNISFFVDDEVNDMKSVYDTSSDKSLVSTLGFTKQDAKVWKGSTSLAPFDEEFHICLGVSAGGSYAFPDDSVSKGNVKPWGNTEIKGLLKFWKSRVDWLPSWLEDVKLYIDHVEVTAL